jgi:hypothetical protein
MLHSLEDLGRCQKATRQKGTTPPKDPDVRQNDGRGTDADFRVIWFLVPSRVTLQTHWIFPL